MSDNRIDDSLRNHRLWFPRLYIKQLLMFVFSSHTTLTHRSIMTCRIDVRLQKVLVGAGASYIVQIAFQRG